MNTKKFTDYSERVSHLAACQGADVTDRAIRMCFDAGIARKVAGGILGYAFNRHGGEAVYTYIARAIAVQTATPGTAEALIAKSLHTGCAVHATWDPKIEAALIAAGGAWRAEGGAGQRVYTKPGEWCVILENF